MPKTLEVFENEEAEKFLEYFSAYKKFSIKADIIKRIISANVENVSWKSFPQVPELETTNQDKTAIGIETTAINREFDFPPAR
jgi:hypothetical protein